MPVKLNAESILAGQALIDAQLPLAATPAGGRDFAFSGMTSSASRKKKRRQVIDPNNPMQDPTLPSGEDDPEAGVQEPNGADDLGEQAQPEVPEADPFAGMGPWLEGDDETVFKTAYDLVMRQEILALNHLAVDTHFARVKQGYPFSTLEKDEGKGTYRSTLPAGSNAMTIQAVPNVAWDLCNKATETVLVDFAQPEVTPLNDSEEAQAAAKMAQRVLDEQAGENGTNDVQLFFTALDRALVISSSYIEKWVDPVGGGYVPLQILAHPEATDVSSPLVGPPVVDPTTGAETPGMPTTDPILRYVTAPEGGQFTDDPEAAAPQWQPKLRSTIWNREHIRVYPEDVPVELAEKVILLGYCTIAEAKRRWKRVAEMEQADLDTLLDWTPPRYLVLLPAFQQARWKVSQGAEKEKQGSSDERIMFYFRVYAKASPENKRGADVVVSGAQDGLVLNKALMAATVEVDTDDGQSVKEVRCLDIPITQVTPRGDPDGRDPSGLSYLWLFAGAVEFDAALATAFLEMLNLWVHPDSYMPSTSVVQDYQITESRLTGVPIPITRPEDKPVFGNQPLLPPNFWQAVDHNKSAIESIASLNKPVTGSDKQQEVSGKARQIAVQQAMVGLSRMQHPTNAARARDGRIAIQLFMRDFSTSAIVRYVGEDGAWQADDWTGTDFALIGGVQIKAGTGTMMPPEAKVNYLGNLVAASMLSPDEARDAARPAFSKSLGLPDNPHQQYVERCISAWLEGPPEGWLNAWAQHKQALEQYQAQIEPMMQQAQQQAAQAAQSGVPAAPLPPPPKPPTPPWTPFQTRPNDGEPAIAKLWALRLSACISSVKYAAMDPAWREPLDAKYKASVAAAQPPVAPSPAGPPAPPAGVPQ